MYQYEPNVSIVIPAYNASDYLAEAIESALAQTYPKIEVLVVNDGSCDDGATAALAAKYGKKIRYFEKENGGPSSAINCGIRHMTGEWFSWLSHDDVYDSRKIEKQIQYLNKLELPEAELEHQVLFSAADFIGADGGILRKADPKKENRIKEAIEHIGGNEYLVAEPTRFTFHGCSCLIHRNVFQRIGMFEEGLRLLNDVDMWYRIYIGGCKVHYLPEPLVKGRIHAGQVSRSIGFSYHNPEQDRYWSNILQWLTENHPEKEALLFRYGRNAYLKTRNAEGDRAFAILCGKKPGLRYSLAVRKYGYQICAKAWHMGKQLVLKVKV